MKFNDLGETAEIIADTPISWYEGFDFAYVKDELAKLKGKPITMWINSPGGDVFAAAEVYTVLREYPGEVVVKIPALAASAATLLAMAADKIYMSPPAMFMIHRPMTLAIGNVDDMQETINMLNEVTDSIIEAYHAKTGIGKDVLKDLINEEYWMSSRKALELGFIDGILGEEEEPVNNKNDLPVYDFKPAEYMEKAVAACLVARKEKPQVEGINIALNDSFKQKELAKLEIEKMRFSVG